MNPLETLNARTIRRDQRRAFLRPAAIFTLAMAALLALIMADTALSAARALPDLLAQAKALKGM